MKEQHDDHCWLKMNHELVWLEHQDGSLSAVDLHGMNLERYCTVAVYLLREAYPESKI